MEPEIYINIDSGNGLLPDGTKLLPKSVLTYHQSYENHLRQISQETCQPSIDNTSLKSAEPNFHSNLPGAGD